MLYYLYPTRNQVRRFKKTPCRHEFAANRPPVGMAEVIDQGLSAAERLHGNFYEVFMTSERAEIALAQVQPLLQILWQQLPDEHTGGVSFDEWVETDED